MNNLPRVVARIMPRSESNPRPLDHESNALPLHHRDVVVLSDSSVRDVCVCVVVNLQLSTSARASEAKNQGDC